MSAAADIMVPLGSYKEVGQGLVGSNSEVKDATLQWLSAAQVCHTKVSGIDYVST